MVTTNRYRGDAQPVAQVTTFTVGGSVVAADTLTVTINRKAVTLTITTETTTAEAASALQLLLAASTLAEFKEITWTVLSSVITGTGDSTTGKPFTATASDSGAMTFVASTTTAATGPYHYSNTNNWTNGTLPSSVENIVIESGTKIYYGLDQNATVVGPIFINNAEIGLPDSTGTYNEYRDTFLRLQTGNITFSGSGQGLIRLDLGCGTTAGATAIQVESTPTSRVVDKPAVQLKNTHQNSTMNALKGSIGLGYNYGENATLLTVRSGYKTSVVGDVFLYTGDGAVVTTLTVAGGQLTLRASVSTLTMDDGRVSVSNGSLGTVQGRGGQIDFQASGTISTLYADSDFAIDFSRDLRPKTIGNCTLYKGATLNDPNKVVTFTNPIALSGCGLSEITLNLGSNFSLQRS